MPAPALRVSESAMTAYYKFMGWGEYTTDQEWDMHPYPEEGGLHFKFNYLETG